MNFEQHPDNPWLSEIRRDFHKHPELGHQEFRTTDKIREILTGMGIQLQELPGQKTGAVGIIYGAENDKTIALRADIDALPMDELNDAPYKSLNPGVMHSCGHDCHTAIMLGVAKRMVETGLAKRLKGNVKFIFQPAEETINGAIMMIENGVLENPMVDRILGGHMNSHMPVGKVGFFTGISHASSDSFELVIRGKGAHGAYPHTGIDPIVAGAHFVSAAQSIVNRNLDPLDSGVVTVGQFVAGTAPNIIPNEARLSGTVRSLRPEVREILVRRLGEIVDSLKISHGVEIDYQYHDGVPACIHDKGVTQETFDTAVRVVGKENVDYFGPQMGGEDYGLFTQRIPGTFLSIGCGNPDKGIIHKGHSPYFDVDETSLVVGVEVFTEAVRSYLGE